jgi:indolepyruvate ferredoxin oxidoreductase
VARRAELLTRYQDRAYAQRYRALVAVADDAEKSRAKGMTGFADAVAHNLFKLMAYKDEYEVARLYTDGDFAKKLRRQFEGDFKLEFHLAPPLLAPRDPVTGHLKKRAYGAWVFRAFKVLAMLRRVRGTALDPFGRTAERRMERQLVADYAALIPELAAALTPDNHALAVEIVRLPAQIRGYGHVKDKSIERAKAREASLLASFRSPASRATAAE